MQEHSEEQDKAIYPLSVAAGILVVVIAAIVLSYVFWFAPGASAPRPPSVGVISII